MMAGSSIGKWPHNVWESIATTFGSILNDDDVAPETKKKKCNGLLDQLPKNSKWLVPFKNPHSAEYKHMAQDCVSFNAWLFGQLYSVFLYDCFEAQQQKCVDTQASLLHYLRENDPAMYCKILKCYLDVFQDVCSVYEKGAGAFRPTTYAWFDSKPFDLVATGPRKAIFNVNNFSQLSDLINCTLLLLSTQIKYVSALCTTISTLLWKSSLSLLERYPNKSPIYKFVSCVASECDLPEHETKPSSVISELLLHVRSSISVLCQSGKLTEEEDFRSMLAVLNEKLRSDTCFDHSYVHSVYCLLLQCQTQWRESTEETVLRFFSKLLRLSKFDHTTANAGLDLSTVNLTLLLRLVPKSIEKCVLQHGDCSTVNVYRNDKYWRFLVQQILAQTQNAYHSANGKEIISSFKSMVIVTQLAANLTYQFRVGFIFFDDRVRDIVDTLVTVCESLVDEQLLGLCLKTVKNVLMLKESTAFDDNIRATLLTLLQLPWTLSYEAAPALKSFYEKYSPLMTDGVRTFSMIALMWVRRYRFENWRDGFFDDVFKHCTPEVLEAMPVLVHQLDDSDVRLFAGHLLRADDRTLTELSTHVRALVCAMSGHCVLAKLPETDLRLYCTLCDENCAPWKVDVNASDHSDVLNRVIVRLMSYSEKAKYNVISVAVHLFNHVRKSEELLALLRGCFLNSDPKIREKIIEITPYVIFGRADSAPYAYDDATFHSFKKCLRAVTLDALMNEDEITQYLCLNAITKIGCVPLEVTLLPSVTMLLCLMISASSAYAPLAKSCIQQVAIAHNVEVEDHVYLKHREHVFPLVTRIIVVNYSVFGVSLTNLPCDHNSVFNALTVNHVLQYLLPYVAEDANLRILVEELATLCGMSTGQLLRNAFKQVFPHVMLFEKTETKKRVMEIVYKETNNTITDLLSCCVTKVLAELFIYYEEFEEQVKWVLCEIKGLANSSKIDKSRDISDLNIESFLQSRFFGVLMKLENQLSADTISSTSRRRVLSSFKTIIRFMSSAYITSVRFKVLFTLRTITDMEKEKTPSLCIDIWDTFVRKIDREMLGPILSNLFVSLLELPDVYREPVNQIFRYLVIENKTAVRANLLELYFVPAHRCDDAIIRIIHKAESALVNMKLTERLEWLLEATKHEITEIKLHALRRLKCELANNRKDISQLILASDSVNRLIFRVLDILVEGFRNPDVSVQEASGACLGEFGAIDPSYIPNIVIKKDDAEKYNCYEIDDVQFVVKSFTLLCRGFQMAKTSSNMDTFALAIQSMLSSYEVTQNEECRYWSQIPKNLREIIQPFYSTTYTLLTYANESSYDIPHLVYGSNKAQTVQKWAYNWSNFLISLLPADSKAKKVFTYCKGPMSCEINCMFLFLPHILLNAVLCSDDADHSKIYEEMISVIRHDKTDARDEADTVQKSSTQLIVSEELSIISNTDLEMGVICTKTMFNLLDVLFKKFRSMRYTRHGMSDRKCDKLKQFLNKFSKYQLAEKSFERKEYVRSLLYLEEYLESSQADVEKFLVLLAKIYVHLNDVDNVKGIFAAHSVKLRQLQHVIMLHEITDQFQDAAICYQQLLKTADSELAPVYEKRMIQCYLAMNQPETALRFVKSLSTVDAKHSKFFYDVECEALWNLSQYDKLEELTACKSAQADDNWGVRIGQSIIHFLNANQRGLEDEFRRIRGVLTKSLHMSTAAFGNYRDSYEHAIKLHILNEFEKVSELVFGIADGRLSDQEWQSKFQSVVKTEFEERLNKLQPTSRALQPVLNIRQVLFSIAGRLLSASKPQLGALFDDEIHKCWLKVIEIANRTRNFQLAYSNIIAIDNYQLKGFFIEKAKYYWEKMEQQEALRTLQHGLQFHFADYADLIKSPGRRLEERKICSEAFMLLGTYNDTIANTDCTTNLDYFKKAYEVCQRSEKTLLKMALYQDKIMRVDSQQNWYKKQPELWVEVVAMYGKSLQYGCEFIYQSLSRMLNVWLDFGKSLNDDIKNLKKTTGDAHAMIENRKRAFTKMLKWLDDLLQKLPTYYFLTSFSLIMSRISHPVHDCFNILKNIIIQCMLNFPNQTLWQFLSLFRTREADPVAKMQSERVNKVLNDDSLSSLRPTIEKFQKIFVEFSVLSNSPKANGINAGKTLLTSVVKRQSSLLLDGFFDSILIPAQKFLTIILPRSANKTVELDSTYNPFPENMVYIAKLRNDVLVYNSMQKPIRISLVGTDGHVYPMILKAQDDLRIDSRAMEFNSVVNMYLKRDVEGRDRGLRIRTYTVLPLIQKTGIIEFIPHLDSMRMITLNMRKTLGIAEVNTKNLKYDKLEPAEKRQKFLELREKFPPVLQEWYRMEFPNPSSWYTARTSYVRTLAVMSIVGHVLGLGDRHNDNILLDYTNGNVVHVDFNALFNKGETLPIPERVPFRLTHSMVKAMGPLGYEGCFLYTCEIVNRILRSRKDQLISVLHTFLYDPLDFFIKKTENMCDAAQNNLQNVEYRMNGGVRSNMRNNSIPLSVEGQTRKLIEEATDVDNLYLMFHGWGAFM